MNYTFNQVFKTNEFDLDVRTSVNYIEIPESDYVDRGYDLSTIQSFFQQLALNDNMKHHLKHKHIWIAGGAVETIMNKKSPKDLDIYFTDSSSFADTLSYLRKNEYFAEDYELLTRLEDRAQSDIDKLRTIDFRHKKGLRPNIQLIKVCYFKTPEHCIDTFDFTACQFAATFDETITVICNPLAINDISNKRLVLHRMTFPADTMRRMLKYANKGYTICRGSMQKMSLAISDVINKQGESANQVMYID
jgi:hypothetical protein